jgi:hypothetical protein
MAYQRELWHIISGSEVRFMCNITSLGYLYNDHPWSSVSDNKASVYGNFEPVSKSCGYKHAHISNPSLLLSTTIYLHRHPSPSITMPIDLSNLSADDIAATTAAMEAARRAREERER